VQTDPIVLNSWPVPSVDSVAGPGPVPAPVSVTGRARLPVIAPDRGRAAATCDQHLRHLARLRNPVERTIGKGLDRLEALSGYLDLGYARLSDYVTERLGISIRRMQQLLRIERRLATLPRLARAFDAGQLHHSHLRLLLQVVTPEDEGVWLEKTGGMPVRDLERLVRSTPSAAAPADEDADEAGPARSISIRLPAAGRNDWERAVEICRRASGAYDPLWRCAEFIVADFLAGAPVTGDDGGAPAACKDDGDQGGDGEVDGAGRCNETSSPPGEAPHRRGADLLRDLPRERAPAVPADQPGDHDPLWAESAATADESPFQLDARLRTLVALRQRIAWQQGRLLRLLADRRLYRELGCTSLEWYCEERLGFGLRRGRALIALDRRLVRLPLLAAAYREGRLSWMKATLAARVARAGTEAAWLKMAASVTVRRLREEVEVALDRTPPSGPGRGDDAAGHPGPVRPGPPLPPGMDGAGRVQLCAPRLDAAGGGAAMPERRRGWSWVRFRAPLAVVDLWEHAFRVCRLASGGPLDDRECLLRILGSFLATWEPRRDAAWRRRHRTFERDGWRCRVPGCSSRRNLQEHHVVFRSQGGGDDTENLVALCATHHLQGIHRGRLRCRPAGAGRLSWELGPRPGGQPLARYMEDVLWEAARESLPGEEVNGMAASG
jgi:hypothetical protein